MPASRRRVRSKRGSKPAARHIDIFFAYPSRPPALGETIKNATEDLEQIPLIQNEAVRFRLWPDLPISGRRLITQITNAIDRSHVFACDLTYPNFNVAFELGYAVANLKRLWISLDTSIENAPRVFKRMFEGIIATGYTGYENRRDLAEGFIRDHPWDTLTQFLLSEAYRNPAPKPEWPAMLYVKPPIISDAVIGTLELLQSSIFASGLIIDDPAENPSENLEWYAERIHRADAVVVHVLAQDHRDAETHNTKASFVAGLAHGFHKPVLMLSHVPFVCPVDYRMLLLAPATAQQCVDYLRTWLDQLEIPKRRPRRPTDEGRRTVKELELRNITIGEPVAEQENLRLDSYFVETSTYFEALEAQTSILVGRRGTGKTANLIALETAIRDDKRSHVCTIKPVGYEVDGLIRLLQEDLRSAERGYLIESLWKLLIYGELATSAHTEISARPSYQPRTASEEELVEYLEGGTDILGVPFSQRLNRAVKSLIGVGALGDVEEQRARISEMLHVGQLQNLRRLLGAVLNKRQKVAVLIDNLDDPWGPGRETTFLSELILGLLRVERDICDDFQHQDRWRQRVNVSMTIFLRSDIFTYVQPLAREQDKWPLRRVIWNDRELLLRVVDQRLKFAAPAKFTIADIWDQLFPAEVVEKSTRDFILDSTLPRPRDVIFLVREAIGIAVNRGHKAITPEDFLDAKERYSTFAFKSILAEDHPEKQKLEAILYEFAGAPKILAGSDVMSRISAAGVDEPDAAFYLNLLCDVTFLGIKTTTGFRFAADESERQTLLEVAKRLASAPGGKEEYMINAPFYQVLQIE